MKLSLDTAAYWRSILCMTLMHPWIVKASQLSQHHHGGALIRKLTQSGLGNFPALLNTFATTGHSMIPTRSVKADFKWIMNTYAAHFCRCEDETYGSVINIQPALLTWSIKPDPLSKSSSRKKRKRGAEVDTNLES